MIAYTYAGYPAWLWLRARWRARPVQKAAHTPYLSIVMVVRNEEAALPAKLHNLLALDYPADRFELVVVSDGSTDRTETLLREHAADPRIKVVLNQLSRGKAAGLNDAMAVAGGEVVVFTDARQFIEPGAVRVLVESLADPEVGCVSGELMLGDPARGEAGRGMGLYWRIEKIVRELESQSGSVVGATGALYAVKREMLADVPPETILDDVYIPMQVARQGKRVVFEPGARAWDAADQGRGREFARKVRTLSGNYQLLQLAPWLLTSANPLRFEFVCHKLLRLVVPFALATLLAASIVLSQPVYRLALALQLCVYGLSILAAVHLGRGLLARASDAAFTFVVLNMAAVVAFANFVTGRKAAWGR
jgi:cellulose synthase/poly-beta-1,6-N-acetylglucosamine synthase-like glycosyltransferase